MAHGMGALWGGLFAHADPAARTAANLDFKKRCAEARVLPYFVPIGGFMLTPRYDDDPETLGQGVKDMAQCGARARLALDHSPIPPVCDPSAACRVTHIGPMGSFVICLHRSA